VVAWGGWICVSSSDFVLFSGKTLFAPLLNGNPPIQKPFINKKNTFGKGHPSPRFFKNITFSNTFLKNIFEVPNI
jgi:hypothetical protein